MRSDIVSAGPLFLTENQVAEITGFSVPTLRRWRGNGSGPKVTKIGNNVRYCPEDIASWRDALRGQKAT